MKVFSEIITLQKVLLEDTNKNLSIGFVPTMGALHEGHLTLVKRAKSENDIVVCSIFVNPTQFNNIDDLKKYPRQEEKDLTLLESVNCDYVFIPKVDEIYPKNEKALPMSFGKLETVMEGKDRPRHFQGVGIIVKKLFEIVSPSKAYFGKKDYQQLLIIKDLKKQFNFNIEIIGCEIVRENDGLAMSSRNQRLSIKERAQAPLIYKTLIEAKKQIKKLDINELKLWVKKEIDANSLMNLSYFEIADSETLMSINNWEESKTPIGFIVVNIGDVRLIDNIELWN